MLSPFHYSLIYFFAGITPQYTPPKAPQKSYPPKNYTNQSSFSLDSSNPNPNTNPSIDSLHFFPLHPDSSIYNGISNCQFDQTVSSVLLSPIDPSTVEIKPNGIIYQPEMSIRMKLHKAFGPGQWGMRAISPVLFNDDIVSRSYALFAQGNFVSEAIGEQKVHPGAMTMTTAVEAAKSNALMRCAKDLGIGNELWDIEFIEKWKDSFAIQVWCEHAKSGKKQMFWRRKDRSPFSYPWTEQNDSNNSRNNTQKPSFQKKKQSSASAQQDEFLDMVNSAQSTAHDMGIPDEYLHTFRTAS